MVRSSQKSLGRTLFTYSKTSNREGEIKSKRSKTSFPPLVLRSNDRTITESLGSRLKVF